MLKFLLNIIFILFFCVELYAQETANAPGRSAEQEAAIQTEKLQKELELSKEQTQKIHEINLHYARERQKSNTRTEAVKRIKNKEDDLRKVLTGEQYRHLQHKRSGYAADEKGSNMPAAQPTNAEPKQTEPKPAVSTRRRTTTPSSASRRANTEEQTSETRENRQTPQTRNSSHERTNRTENRRATPMQRNTAGAARSSSRSSSSSSGRSGNQSRR